eukprot:8616716-Alexandrium_andersonii.AAC.1
MALRGIDTSGAPIAINYGSLGALRGSPGRSVGLSGALRRFPGFSAALRSSPGLSGAFRSRGEPCLVALQISPGRS